jgi:hypothetical protein
MGAPATEEFATRASRSDRALGQRDIVAADGDRNHLHLAVPIVPSAGMLAESGHGRQIESVGKGSTQFGAGSRTGPGGLEVLAFDRGITGTGGLPGYPRGRPGS